MQVWEMKIWKQAHTNDFTNRSVDVKPKKMTGSIL